MYLYSYTKLLSSPRPSNILKRIEGIFYWWVICKREIRFHHIHSKYFCNTLKFVEIYQSNFNPFQGTNSLCILCLKGKRTYKILFHKWGIYNPLTSPTCINWKSYKYILYLILGCNIVSSENPLTLCSPSLCKGLSSSPHYKDLSHYILHMNQGFTNTLSLRTTCSLLFYTK